MTKAPRKIIWSHGNPVQVEPCHHPFCRTLVRSTYVMKLCTEHAHTPNLCPCPACKERDTKAEKEARKAADEAARRREGVRQVIPRIDTYHGDTSRAVAVSLIAEPWEAQG